MPWWIQVHNKLPKTISFKVELFLLCFVSYHYWQRRVSCVFAGRVGEVGGRRACGAGGSEEPDIIFTVYLSDKPWSSNMRAKNINHHQTNKTKMSACMTLTKKQSARGTRGKISRIFQVERWMYKILMEIRLMKKFLVSSDITMLYPETW